MINNKELFPKFKLWANEWFLSVFAGIAVGSQFGNEDPRRLALISFVPLIWSFAKSRSSALLIVLSYYLAAARGIPRGAAIFFGDTTYSMFLGLLLWIVSALILSLPWFILWKIRRASSLIDRILRLFAVYFLISVPPLGLIGWGSPILSAGILFPSLGWLGVIIIILIPVFPKDTFLYSLRTKKFVPLIYFILFFIMVALRAFKVPLSVLSPNEFVAINTNYSKAASGSARFTDGFLRSTDIFRKVIRQKKNYILLPETLAGNWNRASRELWLPIGIYLSRNGQTVITGAEVYGEDLKYDNCLIFLGKDSMIYRQRVPVPFSMWRPFGGRGTANAYWFDNGRVRLSDGRTAVCLICYEQYIVWSFLFSMLHGNADILITSANQWWGRETSLPNIQMQTVCAWASLFGLDLISAVNL